MTLSSFDDILESARLGPYENAFVINAHAPNVCISSMQVRALRLAAALARRGTLFEHAPEDRRLCRVAVIGGGFAGVTFACAAAALGARVTLYEKSSRLMPDQHNSTRYVFPRMFLWPEADAAPNVDRTGDNPMKLLCWDQGTADSARSWVATEAATWMELIGQRLSTVAMVEPTQEEARTACVTSGNAREPFECIVLAVGPPPERRWVEIRKAPYWRHERPAGTGPVVVVGSGDGAAYEAACIAFGHPASADDTTHTDGYARLVDMIRSTPAAESAGHRLLHGLELTVADIDAIEALATQLGPASRDVVLVAKRAKWQQNATVLNQLVFEVMRRATGVTLDEDAADARSRSALVKRLSRPGSEEVAADTPVVLRVGLDEFLAPVTAALHRTSEVVPEAIVSGLATLGRLDARPRLPDNTHLWLRRPVLEIPSLALRFVGIPEDTASARRAADYHTFAVALEPLGLRAALSLGFPPHGGASLGGAFATTSRAQAETVLARVQEEHRRVHARSSWASWEISIMSRAEYEQLQAPRYSVLDLAGKRHQLTSDGWLVGGPVDSDQGGSAYRAPTRQWWSHDVVLRLVARRRPASAR